MYMYTNQKHRINWNSEFSKLFSATNDVKQWGVDNIRKTDKGMYNMDCHLHELANSGLGCHMGGVLAGPNGYANDQKLITNVWVLV